MVCRVLNILSAAILIEGYALINEDNISINIKMLYFGISIFIPFLLLRRMFNQVYSCFS